jgi:hypothetical protein
MRRRLVDIVPAVLLRKEITALDPSSQTRSVTTHITITNCNRIAPSELASKCSIV